MIAEISLREFFARMAPATMQLIARDCGVADADESGCAGSPALAEMLSRKPG